MLEEDEDLSSGEEGTESVDEGEPKEVESKEDEQEEEVIKVISSSKKKKKQKTIPISNGKSAHDSDDDEEGATNMFLKQADSDDDWGGPSSKAKKSKAKTATKKESKQKKSKSNPVTEDPPPVATTNPIDIDSDEKPSSAAVDVDHKCVTCKEEFSSKNKLFTHLKKTNHGVYIPKGKVVTESDIPDLRKSKNKRRN